MLEISDSKCMVNSCLLSCSIRESVAVLLSVLNSSAKIIIVTSPNLSA